MGNFVAQYFGPKSALNSISVSNNELIKTLNVFSSFIFNSLADI